MGAAPPHDSHKKIEIYPGGGVDKPEERCYTFFDVERTAVPGFGRTSKARYGR